MSKRKLFTKFIKVVNTNKQCSLKDMYNIAGADPVVLLTDALNLALVGGSGGILPREILKSRTSEMRFPVF